MDLAGYSRFPFADLDQLRSEIMSRRLPIPTADDWAPLAASLAVGGVTLPNRLCVQPMEGNDADPGGAPSSLTFRRYERYARGGAGLIWIEATAVTEGARSRDGQLVLTAANVGTFAQLVTWIRQTGREENGHDPAVILQLAHANQPVTDDALDALQETYAGVAGLAAEAGVDGVDIKSCHGELVATLLAGHTRRGRYGGSFENRARFLLETAARIRAQLPGLLLCTRMPADDDRDGLSGPPDLAEPILLARSLAAAGFSLVNVSTAVPDTTDPLAALARRVAVARVVQEAVPDLPVVCGGFSWLRHLIPSVAAGVVGTGASACVGLGRTALAYPDAAARILGNVPLDPARCCMVCGACSDLLREGGRTGCVIRDAAVYGPIYRHQRRFSLDHLAREAQRCHDCEAAPCTAACPAHIDVPAFVTAFRDGDTRRAYDIMRQSNVLPEMCSHLCPAWMQCEGACIENTISGQPIPIRDLQYVISWLARSEGAIGLACPDRPSGRRVAVVGGGPAGLSCAAGLLERGHEVVLFERGDTLGGTPEQLIPGSRYPGAADEVAAVLAPARAAGRLAIRFGCALGDGLSLQMLRDTHDAVCLATGLWREHGGAGRPPGVVDAVSFLAAVKAGARAAVPPRVAVLAGGDCAMDAAVVARNLGADDVFVVYPGTRADMHWHMAEGWFAEQGVHALVLTEPTGYDTDAAGAVTGLRIRRTAPGPADAGGRRSVEPLADSGTVLPVALVIEATGLEPADDVRGALGEDALGADGLVRTRTAGSHATTRDGVFAVGALLNGGASVAQCIAEGMAAAEEIDQWMAERVPGE